MYGEAFSFSEMVSFVCVVFILPVLIAILRKGK